MSSTLFPKNRQQAQRWQRKKTAVNSHNDRFTIYAQIQPHLYLHAHSQNGNSNHHNPNNNVDTNNHQNNNLNRRYERTNVDSHNSESETPIARSQISKLRETLENLQKVNFGDGQDRPVCRNISSSRNKQINSNIEHSQQQNQSHQDYNRKLDVMKQRLQMISRKQYKDKDKDKIMKSKPIKNIQSPIASMSGSLSMAMGGHSGPGSRNLSSKNNSQQSTKRDKGAHYGKGGAMGYGYKDYQDYRNQMRDSRESRGSHNRNSQELVRRLQDSSIRAAKNTVPMPTIIHEDQFQLQTQHRISSTINFPEYSNKHFQKSEQYSQYKRYKLANKHQQIQHNFEYQHENLDEPSHIKSYINIHNQGDTISQKKIGAKNSNVNVKFNHSQSYYQLFPSHSDQIGFGKSKKEVDKECGSRGSQGRHRRDMQLFGEMRDRLDTIEASWVNGFAERKVGSQIRFKQSGTKQNNPSNQPTKRKQGRTPQHAQSRGRSNTAILFNQKQRRQEKEKRSNNTRSITQKDSGINNSKSPYILANKKEGKIMSSDANGRSININTAPNPHPSSYNDYYSKLTPTAQNQSNIIPNFQQQSNGLKIHRAPIKQMLFHINTNNVVDIFTGSLDYQVKHTTLDPNHPTSTSLYKHRGPITALQQTPTIIMSTSTDLYLKYTQNPTLVTVNEAPMPTMYRFASCPQQLSLIDFQHVLVGCKRQLCLFDLNLNQIAIQVGISGNYTLMQNGGVVYVGQEKALSVVDFRIQGGIVKVCDELPNVNRWMMHPFQEFCIIQCDNMLLQMNLRLRAQARKTRAIYQIGNETKIKSHSFNISSKINPIVSGTHKLTLLTQQPLLKSSQNQRAKEIGNKQTVRNKILQLQLNQDGLLQQSYVSLFTGSKQYCTTLSNSFNIATCFGNTVYAGAKDGSLYGFVAETMKRGQGFAEEGRSKSRSRANASVSRSKDTRKR